MTFASIAPISLPSNSKPQSIAVADFNGAGLLDDPALVEDQDPAAGSEHP